MTNDIIFNLVMYFQRSIQRCKLANISLHFNLKSMQYLYSGQDSFYFKFENNFMRAVL